MKSDANPESSPAAGGPATLADLPPPGRRALGLLVLWAIFVAAAFWPLLSFDPEPMSMAEFEGVFFTPSDTSPSIVLLLSAWLLYHRRQRLLSQPLASGPPWLGLGLLLLSGGILAWATFVGASDLRVPALMAAVLGTGALFGGVRATRTLVLPVFLLLFAMPAPAPLLNAVLFQLQFWTADFAGALLHQMGSPVFVTGDLILREGNSFAIIETCSGVRIIETLTMLTILMLDLFRRRPLHSVLLLVLAPVVAFFCNGIRAVTLILNPHSDITEVHTLQGIGMLLGGLLVLYAIDGVLVRVMPRRLPAAATPPSRPAPRSDGRSAATWRARGLTAVLAAFAAIAFLVPPWSPLQSGRNPDLRGDFDHVGAWRSDDLSVDRRFLGRIGMQGDVSRRYRRNGEVVDFYAAVGARSQRPRSVLFGKTALPGTGWNTQETGAIRLEPGEIDANWRVAVSGTRKYFVVYWQEAAGGLLGETLRSFLGLDQSPLRRLGEGVVVRISTVMTGSGPESRAEAGARLLEFYADVRPTLDALHTRLRGDTT